MTEKNKNKTIINKLLDATIALGIVLMLVLCGVVIYVKFSEPESLLGYLPQNTLQATEYNSLDLLDQESFAVIEHSLPPETKVTQVVKAQILNDIYGEIHPAYIVGISRKIGSTGLETNKLEFNGQNWYKKRLAPNIFLLTRSEYDTRTQATLAGDPTFAEVQFNLPQQYEVAEIFNWRRMSARQQTTQVYSWEEQLLRNLISTMAFTKNVLLPIESTVTQKTNKMMMSYTATMPNKKLPVAARQYQPNLFTQLPKGAENIIGGQEFITRLADVLIPGQKISDFLANTHITSNDTSILAKVFNQEAVVFTMEERWIGLVPLPNQVEFSDLLTSLAVINGHLNPVREEFKLRDGGTGQILSAQESLPLTKTSSPAGDTYVMSWLTNEQVQETVYFTKIKGKNLVLVTQAQEAITAYEEAEKGEKQPQLTMIQSDFTENADQIGIIPNTALSDISSKSVVIEALTSTQEDHFGITTNQFTDGIQMTIAPYEQN